MRSRNWVQVAEYNRGLWDVNASEIFQFETKVWLSEEEFGEKKREPRTLDSDDCHLRVVFGNAVCHLTPPRSQIIEQGIVVLRDKVLKVSRY